MFSKFFIERPIFANVLAIVTMLIGAVTVFVLPIEQYPQITPPTVQVTTTYPGADSKTLSDTVASPIEQEVNGVEGMLYMSSTCASDGSYNLTVTFDVGHQPRHGPGPRAEPGGDRPAQAPAGGPAAGDHDQEEVDRHHPGRRPDLEEGQQEAVRQPLPEQLRDPPGQGRPEPDQGRRRHQHLRGEQLRDADLARPGEAQGPEPDHARRPQRDPGAERPGRRRPGRAPPTPGDQDFQYTVTTLGRLKDPEQFANIIVKTDSRQHRGAGGAS